MDSDQVAATVQALVGEISPILAGNEPEIVGATLADLTATLLAGFQGPGVPELREEMLVEFVRVVRMLVPINEREMLKRMKAAGH